MSSMVIAKGDVPEFNVGFADQRSVEIVWNKGEVGFQVVVTDNRGTTHVKTHAATRRKALRKFCDILLASAKAYVKDHNEWATKNKLPLIKED